MKRISIYIILIHLALNVQAQVEGVYVGEIEAEGGDISQNSLTINHDGGYCLIERTTIIDSELPQQRIKQTIGTFIQHSEGLTLRSKTIKNFIVAYDKFNTSEIIDPQRLNNNSLKKTDTTELSLIAIEEINNLRLYKKPNSVYLCNCEGNKFFMKLLKTDSGKDHNFYIEDVKSQNYIDCVVNSYDRSYRSTLNISDSILIDRQLDTLSYDCDKIVEYIHSRNFSGEYIKQLVAGMIGLELCPLQIFDEINYFFFHDESLRSWEDRNYPIRYLLSKNIHLRNNFFMLMQDENVICNSSYLDSLLSFSEKQYAKYILKQYEQTIKNKESLRKCELEKIFKLE